MNQDDFIRKWRGRTLDDSVLEDLVHDLETYEKSIKRWALPIPQDEILRCVVFWDRVAWVSVWLDRYLVSQGPTPEAAIEELAFVMRASQVVAIEHGQKDGLEPLTRTAPPELWGRLRQPLS